MWGLLEVFAFVRLSALEASNTTFFLSACEHPPPHLATVMWHFDITLVMMWHIDITLAMTWHVDITLAMMWRIDITRR